MSTSILRYIPADPQFLPAPEALEQARALLAGFVPQARSVTADAQAHIQFFDPAANWSGVRCPACGADAQGWWVGAMNQWFDAGQGPDLMTTARCCGAGVSLNELNYLSTSGFARWSLSALVSEASVSADQQAQLEAALCCKLRKIWVLI